MAGRLLLVEDDANDLELILRALNQHRLTNGIVVARDGAEALDYLHCRGAYASRETGNPLVILLDLKMPKVDGLEVLREIRASPALQACPVVMLTSSREEQDIVQSYATGANAYVVKPVEFDKFVEAVRRLGLFWLLCNEPPPGSVR